MVDSRSGWSAVGLFEKGTPYLAVGRYLARMPSTVASVEGTTTYGLIMPHPEGGAAQLRGVCSRNAELGLWQRVVSCDARTYVKVRVVRVARVARVVRVACTVALTCDDVHPDAAENHESHEIMKSIKDMKRIEGYERYRSQGRTPRCRSHLGYRNHERHRSRSAPRPLWIVPTGGGPVNPS